jgi:hypothetical protein
MLSYPSAVVFSVYEEKKNTSIILGMSLSGENNHFYRVIQLSNSQVYKASQFYKNKN